MYDYEEIIFDALVTNDGNDHTGNKHLWIKKATGLGISEFILRLMAWLCLKDNALSSSQMCIVIGPRIDLAIAMIDRLKTLFAGKGLVFSYFLMKNCSRSELPPVLELISVISCSAVLFVGLSDIFIWENLIGILSSDN